MAVYSFEWRRYRRLFRQPLRTHHGSWSEREGIIVRLQHNNQQMGWGEIAPISWFGSETIDQAIEFCQSLKGQITEEQIAEIPNQLPACQFGLESALETLGCGAIDTASRLNLPCSVLLSLEAVLADETKLEQGEESYIRSLNPLMLENFEIQNERLGSFQPRGASLRGKHSSRILSEFGEPELTFKCKIGVQAIDREMAQLDRLLKVLPKQAKLRLDANGGLSETEAYRWLEWCDCHFQNPPQIELIEQPLSPDQFEQMQQLNQQFHTPIGLDESVATIDQLQDCYRQGWRGIFVIKPAIAGSPSRLRQFCQEYQPDVIWSSALETTIGRRYIEDFLIPSTQLTERAIGFGVDQWFADDWGKQEADLLWRDLAEVGS